MINTSQTQIFALVGFLSVVSYIVYRYTSTNRERSTRSVVESTTESYTVTTLTTEKDAESDGVYQRNKGENNDEKVEKVHLLTENNDKSPKKHEKPRAPVAPTLVLKKFGIADPTISLETEMKVAEIKFNESSKNEEEISISEKLPKLEIIEESQNITSKVEATNITTEKKEFLPSKVEKQEEQQAPRKKGKLEKANSVLGKRMNLVNPLTVPKKLRDIIIKESLILESWLE